MKRKPSIAIFSPAGAVVHPEDVHSGIRYLEGQGFQLVLSDFTFSRKGLFPESPEILARDFMKLYLNPDIDILMASRGGYGSARLLPFLDYQAIAATKKIVCGYSDLTALLNTLHEKSGIEVLHSPMACSFGAPFSQRSGDSLLGLLKSGSGFEPYDLIASHKITQKDHLSILSSGTAQGILKGGNLAVLTSLLGSDYEVDTRGSILFLEDVNEETYKVHRMMNQLKMSGALQDASAFLIGQFSHSEPPAKEDHDIPDYLDIMNEFLLPLGKPVLWNFPAGHTGDNITLIIGKELKMELEGDAVRLEYV